MMNMIRDGQEPMHFDLDDINSSMYDFGQTSCTKKRYRMQEVKHPQPLKMCCCVNLGWSQVWIQFEKPNKRASSNGKKFHKRYHEHNNYVEPHAIHTTRNESLMRQKVKSQIRKHLIGAFSAYKPK